MFRGVTLRTYVVIHIIPQVWMQTLVLPLSEFAHFCRFLDQELQTRDLSSSCVDDCARRTVDLMTMDPSAMATTVARGLAELGELGERQAHRAQHEATEFDHHADSQGHAPVDRLDKRGAREMILFEGPKLKRERESTSRSASRSKRSARKRSAIPKVLLPKSMEDVLTETVDCGVVPQLRPRSCPMSQTHRYLEI